MQNRRPIPVAAIRRLGEAEVFREILTVSTGLIVILSVVAYVLTI